MVFLGWILVAFGRIGYTATYTAESNAVFPWTILFIVSAIFATLILVANGTDLIDLN